MMNQKQIGSVSKSILHLGASLIDADISQMEGCIPREFGHDAVEIPGSRKLLADMEERKARWAVVTSGTRALVEGWIEVLHLAYPKNLVVAEDVEIGKPDPACYLLGQKRLGLAGDSDILVVEDAPSGIRAGKAAGFKVVGLTTTHSIAQVQAAGADWIVQDLKSIRVLEEKDGVTRIEIKNALLRGS